MLNKRAKKTFAVSALAFFFALVSFSAARAQLGAEVGAQAGLGGGDIRVIIGRIIQVALGLLGVVALVLIIYAGFLWMTAGGDEEKVANAKRIMTQAIIGLAIILSAFAIASFVINSLVSATGGNVGNGGGGGGGGGGGLSTSDFTVSAINPPGSMAADFKFPKNVQVAIIFKNGSPNPTTANTDSISVTTGGNAVPGTVKVKGNEAIWSSVTKCEENADYFCLPADSTFKVSVSASIKSLGGRLLVCGLCSAGFQTGNYIDTQPPTISISEPINNQSVPVDSIVKIFSDAKDDSAVASVDYSADAKELGIVGVDPWEYDWDTTGIAPQTNVSLGAEATDLVGNTASAAPVNVILRPIHCFNKVKDEDETGVDCGPSCGACPGQPCAKDSDCASGVCLNNICVDKPRIDSVDPLAGGPGTLVSIHGAGFGSAPGHVVFLGKKAGDEKSAPPCAPAAWTNYEVIVAVPDGAVSGPLELDTASNGSDRTDDAFGNSSIPDFTVTDAKLPGICTLAPAAGAPGTAVAINGTGYGDTQGTNEADFAARAANVSVWSGSAITAAAPNLLSGIWPVNVKVGAAKSNSVSFTVPQAGGVPHILSIDPTSGPVGEYITIAGADFGDTPGKVQFTLAPDTYLGGTDFPADCSNDFWHDTSITVKAPTGGTIGTYTVRVVSVSGVQSDNTVSFTIGGGTPKPGVCRIDPSAGPPNTKFSLYGERLGATKGTVTFTKDQPVTSFSSWNDGQIGGAVHPSAKTGAVSATEAGGNTSSNWVLFKVGNCKTDNICQEGDLCCDDGTCRTPTADVPSPCAVTARNGAYAYRFSTGDIPLVPHVIEDPSCDTYPQSPSPYLSTEDACVNAVLVARFDVGMNAETFTPANFYVVPCGTDDKFDAKKCGTAPLPGKIKPFGASQPVESGMKLSLTNNLTPKTWYLATVSKNVASVAGVNMDQDYTWAFRVRDSSDPCAISGINVCPSDLTLSDIFKETDTEKQENITYANYLASPHAANCNALECGSYGWDWNSSLPNNAFVHGSEKGGDDACTAVAYALQETPAKNPAKVNAVASVLGTPNKVLATGTGTLTVKFVDPKVILWWPNCDKACLEAEVGAEFNTAMDMQTVTKNNVKLFGCADQTCTTTTDLDASVDYADTDKHIVIFHGETLVANKYYLVRISNRVASTAGVALTGTNSMWDGAPVFSWSFRVGPDHCKVSAVGVSPAEVTTNVVGEYDSLTAVPMTAPDTCSPSGERIDAFKIKDWTWKIDSTNPPLPSAGAELYVTGTANVRPIASDYVTSNCLNTGTVAKRPVCGNGVVEDGKGNPKSFGVVKGGGAGGEECDLGKDKDGKSLNDPPDMATDGSVGSGCSASCLFTGARTNVCAKSGGKNCCGDGIVQGVCQPDVIGFAALDNPTVCTSDKDCDANNPHCRFDVPGAEQCDAGTDNGKIDKDGNPISGCSAKCLALGSNSVIPPTTCGNNDLAYNEQCDDGNNASGDGCSAECRDEGSTSGISVCGNGKPDGSVPPEPGEDCDLGSANGQPGSGCSADCRRTGIRTCQSSTDNVCCGDKVDNEPGKDHGCDLGWDADTDQPKVAEDCDNSCRKLGSWFGYSTPSVCADHTIGLGETVDPGSSDLFVDPTQYSHTIGKGDPDDKTHAFTSTVTATTGGVSGTGTVILQCGYASDDQCPRGRFVGYNTCCYAPPDITGTNPTDGQTNVCRNPLIEVLFDRLIDEKTVPGNVEVSKNSDCHAPVAIKTDTGWKGLIRRISDFFGKLWDLVFGRPAEAQNVNNANDNSNDNANANANVPAAGTTTDPCLVPGTVTTVTEKDAKTGAPYSVVQFTPTAALDPDAYYTIKILGIDDSGAHIRSADGVALQLKGKGFDFAVFKTGADICTLDEVLVNTDPLAKANLDNYLFSDITKLSDTFNAIPVHDESDGTVQPIAPLKDVYDWTWQWASSDTSLVTAAGTDAAQTVAVATNPIKSGDAAVTAAATIANDTILKPSTKDTSVAGESDVTVMICSAPWPAGSGSNWAPWPLRKADGSAPDSSPDPLPADVGKYNFSFYYCRDSDSGQLPTLGDSAVTDDPNADFLRQYLITYTGEKDPKTEGIGIRVAANPKWLSPTAYYAARGFTASPQPAKIAGYNAVVDGRTFYVDAPNYDSDSTTIYPNIYIFSYSEGAGAATQNVFSQIKKNLRFNANMSGFKLDERTCDQARATSCSADTDCSGKNPTDFCSSPRERLARDTTRLEDMSTLAKSLVNAKARAGAYPQLISGTFLGGYSYSVWPSWSAEFGSELGAGSPADPLNKIGLCGQGVCAKNASASCSKDADCGAGDTCDTSKSLFEAATCWNQTQKQFTCPADSYLYGYGPDAVSGFNLVMNMESKENLYFFKICPDSAADPCASDPLCFMNGNACMPRVNFDKQCDGSTVSAGNGVCGDGVLEADEQCEKGMTRTESCGTKSYAIDSCDASCRWLPGVCQKTTCGDGVRQGFCTHGGSVCAKDADCQNGGICNFAAPGETCDDGKLNGTYNHCNSSCSGYAARCGDGVVQPNEKCDCGTDGNGAAVGGADCGGPNGQYGSGCSLDCQSEGPHCGNGKVELGEECDGGSEDSPSDCGKDANGIQMVRTQTCNPPGSIDQECHWSDYGDCHTPVGAGCGDHKMPEGTKQCDNGANNGIHGSCLPDCVKASCGDGFLEIGFEQCDDGKNNVSPLDTTKLSALAGACKSSTCAYCTNACTIGTVSGGFCGDGVWPEGNKECDNGADNVNLSDKAAVDAANKSAQDAGCSPSNLTACNYCSAQCKNVSAPFCGDGVKQSNESCDKGTQNGATDGNGTVKSGCDSSCKCVGDGFYSGWLAGTVSSNSDYSNGVAVTKVVQQNGWWPTINKALPIWSGNVATTNHQYFKFPFTLNNSVTSAKLIIGADNHFKAWIDSYSGNALASGDDYLQPALADITSNLSGSMAHTLYVEAWNSDTTSKAGLWFAIVTNPKCDQVSSIPVCQATGYTIYSDTNNMVTSIVNPSPYPNAAPPATPFNAFFISNPSIYGSWAAAQTDPRMTGSKWIWYAAYSNTYQGSNSNKPEHVTFTRSISVPGNPVDATINLMADDALHVYLNGSSTEECPTNYCPTGDCSSSQKINTCNIAKDLVSGNNKFTFVVDNWNTWGAFVYKATIQTDCGVGQPTPTPAPAPTPPAPTGPCGNGVLDPGETCDPGINYPKAGGCNIGICSATCSGCVIY